MHPTLTQLLEKFPALEPLLPQVQRTYDVLLACYQRGGQVLICGNGGSASDAEHVVGELMKGYLSRRPVTAELRAALTAAYPAEGAYLADKLQGALPTISLASHTSLITAIVNDIAGDLIFAQQVYGYGRPGDVLLAISTSGNSPNVLHAVRVAHVRGLTTIGFTGRGGGQLAALADVALCVPADRTADIQERHLALYHALCALLEEALFPQ
jgi:D-sedoheptulose 7-phosphate isomerase